MNNDQVHNKRYFAGVSEDNVVYVMAVIPPCQCTGECQDECLQATEGMLNNLYEVSENSKWVQTWKDGRHKYNFASIGDTYDQSAPAFYSQKPFDSWVLDREFFHWKPPSPMPESLNGEKWVWNESILDWVSFEWKHG